MLPFSKRSSAQYCARIYCFIKFYLNILLRLPPSSSIWSLSKTKICK
jgi:hypothetical protein